MKHLLLILGLVGVVWLAAAQGQRQFTGSITDSECAKGDHSGMRMGNTAAECTIACVLAHGAQYVLFDGENVYILSDQETPEKFAGQKVTVTGTLNTRTMTIRVRSITAAK